MYFRARHRESSEDLLELRTKNSVFVYSRSVIEYEYGSNNGYCICTSLCCHDVSVLLITLITIAEGLKFKSYLGT